MVDTVVAFTRTSARLISACELLLDALQVRSWQEGEQIDPKCCPPAAPSAFFVWVSHDYIKVPWCCRTCMGLG